MKYGTFLLVIIFFSCSDPHKVIRIKGSDTEVNLAVNLAENFHKTDEVFSVSISGGGSGLGIASLLNGQADIANSSRPLTDEEITLFDKKNIILKTIIFAKDATAFIVHQHSPIDSIDVETLSKIMSGEYSSWEPVTGKNMPVTIYGRQSNSGTHSFIKQKLKIEFSRDAKEMNGNAQILESVRQDISGIGYVGAGYISENSMGQNNGGVKILKIAEKDKAAVSPLDKTAIQNHLYYFQRPLFQFIPARSWEKVQPFLQFEMSSAGQELIEKEGYYNVQ